MAEDRTLPGMPKKRLVHEVRKSLRHYGIHPTARYSITSGIWTQTWAWANEVAHSYFTKRWPLASEIASQYVLLLLLTMKENRSLRLPYRAMSVKQLPVLLLSDTEPMSLTFEE